MNIGTLIALAARRVFEESEQRMGARLSPVTLTAAELSAAVQELRAQLGPKVYIVGSAPKVDVAEPDARAFIAPDQRAAERATLWRNKVRVAEKERLVYVSVEGHAKANGLRDCLEQLRERDLREAFKGWASKRSGLPSGLVEALEEAEMLGSVRLATLCEFAERVASAGQKSAGAWQVAGAALPVINLAADSKLGKEDASERLRANHALVRALETGEGRRRAASGPLAEVEEALHAGFVKPPKGGRRAALASVDLGAVKTSILAKGKPAKPKAAASDAKAAKDLPRGGKDASTKPTKGDASKPAPAEQPRTEPRTPLLNSPIELVLGGEPRGDAPRGAVPGVATQQPPAPGAPKAPARLVRLVGSPLPRGLMAMLTQLLEGNGDPVELTVTHADRSHLNDLAKTLSPEAREARRARERLGAAHALWAEARRALLEMTLAIPDAPPIADALTRGLPSLLKEPAFGSALSRLVDASVALYEAAGDSDERTMREVLTLDTVAVRGADRAVALRVIGPLHLLSIGQSLLARRALDGGQDLPEQARRLIARAMEVAPPAPGLFPDDTGELPLAQGVGGLLAYERVPELVSLADATAAARAVVTRYIALCPHALLGLRVAVSGAGDLTALVEGVAAATLDASTRPDRVEVLCARPPSFDARSSSARAVSEGVMTVGALDEPGARGAHVTLRFASAQGAPEDDEAAAPTVSAFAPPGGARTTFDLRAHGLRVLTSISGARELVAVEALTARAMGGLPRGAFMMDVAGRSLRAECEGVTSEGGWLAVIGRSLGRRPPAPWFLIAHEEVGARATCAVVSRDVRSAARSLHEGLAALGVSDMRPRSLLLLAERLASAGRSSLVPLGRPAAALVVSGLLALELRKSLGDVDALIAPVTGAVYETLLGKADEGEGDTLQIAATRVASGGLRFAVGYATASSSPDLDTSKAQLDGPIAKRVSRVLEAIAASGEGARADAGAAREAIAWALWGAVAADEASHSGWREELTRWSGSVAAPTEALVLAKSSDNNAKERNGKIGRVKVVVRPLALERLNAMLLGGR